MRIAIGGFQHETNTFAPSKATWEDFVAGGGWPAMVSGQPMFAAVAGANMPIAGFIAAAQAHQHTLIPTTWCSASPSAQVTQDAYERIAGMIVEAIRAAMPVDAVYLDLHGAMVAEHLDDGEGEILRRVRQVIGPHLPLVASLDLHANITSEMVEHADALVAYRTYPHVDMAETGARAFALLQRRLEGLPREKNALRRIPYLMPLCWQSTDLQPAKSLYQQLGEIEHAHRITLTSMSFATGFPAADFPQCGPVVLAYGLTQAAADEAADQLTRSVLAAERSFAGTLYDPDAAVLKAMELATHAAKPIVIADTQIIRVRVVIRIPPVFCVH